MASITILPKTQQQQKPSGGKPLIAKLMGFQQALALNHWLTTSYAQHKALGKAYENLAEKIDGFVESLIGVKGRSVIANITILDVGGNVQSILNGIEAVLRNDIPALVGPNETALLNLRDDMLDLVQHTRYLLTLG